MQALAAHIHEITQTRAERSFNDRLPDDIQPNVAWGIIKKFNISPKLLSPAIGANERTIKKWNADNAIKIQDKFGRKISSAAQFINWLRAFGLTDEQISTLLKRKSEVKIVDEDRTDGSKREATFLEAACDPAVQEELFSKTAESFNKD